MTVSSLSSAAVQSQIALYQSRLQAPITSLQTQITTDNAQISAWGSIKGNISSLSTALAKISDVASLATRTTSSTSSSTVTAAATNSAQVGTYSVTNVSLAKGQTIYSGIKSSGGASIGASAGSLTFVQNGKTETISVGSGSLTLNGVAGAINKAKDGVAASIVNTAGGARLVLQSSATGSSQAFSVAGTGALATFDYNPSSGASGSWTAAQTARNATLKINGVPISNATNSLSSAVTGLSLTLASSGSSTVQVSQSNAALTSALTSVTASLNAAISGIQTQTKYVAASGSGSTATTAQAGPLLGNFTATNISYNLVNAVAGAAASGVTSNSIGLTVNSSGQVSFDSTKFSSAYASNPTGVQALLSKIYDSLNNTTSLALGGDNGSGNIGAQTTSLNSQVATINAQITQITKQNNSALSLLISQYTLAETQSTQAQITQAYLNIFLTSGSSTGSA
ncbi:MAG TPA: flagellar filament capping protein FliD [Acidisoma sp.]|uniref:flagellar filament capping protein FliD n=1 Tax=Acidisoma sp. TaxID=1872115 RepID=UPI002BC9804A|nr:flagellar filament capping protein FliD [Acidisoma sp.]HTI00226.1 flagellar filament capping protein FliD [Acidisoma sp.]